MSNESTIRIEAHPAFHARNFSLLALGLASVLALAPMWRKKVPSVEPTPAAPASFESLADKMLEGLPVTEADTKTGEIVYAALARVKKFPRDAAAWTTLGDALAQQMRGSGNELYYGAAEKAYHAALRLNPAKVEAMTGMAWVFGGRHSFDISIDWAREALSLETDNPAAHGICGDAAVELGDYENAFEHYQKMMDARPDLSSWSRGAHLLWLTGNRGKALWLMEKSARAGAPYAENTDWCRANLAMMLFQDGAFLPAAQALEPSLATNTRNVHVLLAAGRIAAARGDLEGAAGHFKKILEQGPNHDALVALGDLHASRGELAEAEQYYAQIESLHRANLATGHSHMNVARFFADHDRNLSEALRIVSQRKPTRNVMEADTVAWVYFKNGDQVHAIEAMKLALSRKTPDAEMQFHAGMIAAASGDRVSAAKHLQSALSFNPRFSILQSRIAVEKLEELGGITVAGH